ncbi:MAG TPA: glycosyltransferase [Patescibacteria group bacterium]|nr:glycosyltransferase [Patescibacteria group bacterium]
MLSIIIPTLNEEKVIGETLRGLQDLRISDCEVIVSDGASRDRTVEIAGHYADRIVRHEQDWRQTIGQGRNAGAAVAVGDILLFMDADVRVPDINGFFAHALRLFAEDASLAGLTVFLKVVPEEVTLSDRLFFGLVNRIYQVSNNWLHVGAASGEFQMVRASAFRQVGGFNPKIVVGEDNDLFARLGKVGSTRVETGLHVFHTSRRAHRIGWPQLLSLWLMNLVFAKLLRRSYSKEWRPVR